ncbi:MAG: VRR-NUC domain-containing protein [Bacteroidales bacterium]|nr:VRR-NUC domain-containing protein [Bacteroidales bacterium]
MNHPESDLQKACVKWFDYRWPKYSNLLICVPNGGKRNAREAARFKAEGVRPGVADLILLVPYNFGLPKCQVLDYYLCLELKSDKGRQTEHQKAFQHDVEVAGGRYVVIRSLDEFIEIINDYLL